MERINTWILEISILSQSLWFSSQMKKLKSKNATMEISETAFFSVLSFKTKTSTNSLLSKQNLQKFWFIRLNIICFNYLKNSFWMNNEIFVFQELLIITIRGYFNACSITCNLWINVYFIRLILNSKTLCKKLSLTSSLLNILISLYETWIM